MRPVLCYYNTQGCVKNRIFIDHTMNILLFLVSALILKVSLVRAISAESQKLDYVSFPGGGVQHVD